MIFLDHGDSIIREVLSCVLEFSEYVFFEAAVLVIVHVVFKKLPSYIFRKLLHFVAFSSLAEMTMEAEEWYTAALSSILFALVLFPVLQALENCRWYKGLFVEKKKGEVKKSLLLLFGMYAFLASFCWGLIGKRYITVTALLMWGVGDTAAAVVGRTFGRHRTGLRWADENKTWEGSSAMLVCAFLAGSVGMMISGVTEWWRIVFYPLLAAPFSSFTELVSRGGDDTVTVPVVTAFVIALLSLVF